MRTFDERRTFKVIVDDLEVTLKEAAAKVLEEPFEQATRPTDAYTLGNHPAFQGIGISAADGAAGSEDYDEAKGVEEAAAAAAAAAGNRPETIVVKVLHDIRLCSLWLLVGFVVVVLTVVQ